MRETLYRGKRKDTGEWVYGYYVAADGEHYIFTGETGLSQVTPVHCLMYKDFVRYEVIPETVGQYTGLKDRNGVKIFEGDIVKYQSSMYVVKHTKIVSAFEMYRIGDNLRLPVMHLSYSTIKGNIHDAPELLGRE